MRSPVNGVKSLKKGKIIRNIILVIENPKIKKAPCDFAYFASELAISVPQNADVPKLASCKIGYSCPSCSSVDALVGTAIKLPDRQRECTTGQ